jgi:hypothetical protein
MPVDSRHLIWRGGIGIVVAWNESHPRTCFGRSLGTHKAVDGPWYQPFLSSHLLVQPNHLDLESVVPLVVLIETDRIVTGLSDDTPHKVVVV